MSIFKMKAYIPVMYVNLKPREDCRKEDFHIDLTDAQFSVLRRLGALLMETKFTTLASKLYMQYPDASQETVALKLDNANVNTIKGRIRYDSERLSTLYKGDIVEKITTSTNERDLALIDSMLIGRINSFPRVTDTTQNLFTVPIPAVETVYSSEVTDEEFEYIKAGAAKLSIKVADDTLKKLGQKGIGYLRYLLDSEPIDSVDVRRRKELLSMIK